MNTSTKLSKPLIQQLRAIACNTRYHIDTRWDVLSDVIDEALALREGILRTKRNPQTVLAQQHRVTEPVPAEEGDSSSG
jgi:hypothetical protein